MLTNQPCFLMSGQDHQSRDLSVQGHANNMSVEQRPGSRPFGVQMSKQHHCVSHLINQNTETNAPSASVAKSRPGLFIDMGHCCHVPIIHPKLHLLNSSHLGVSANSDQHRSKQQPPGRSEEFGGSGRKWISSSTETWLISTLQFMTPMFDSAQA